MKDQYIIQFNHLINVQFNGTKEEFTKLFEQYNQNIMKMIREGLVELMAESLDRDQIYYIRVNDRSEENKATIIYDKFKDWF